MTHKTILSVSGAALGIIVGAVLLAFGLPSSGFKALSVQTGSMEPSIKPGHLVLVKSIKPTDIAVGDVITYSSADKPGQTITHRVTEVRSDGNKPLQFVTKGDANPSVDPKTIPVHRVVGKVSANIPYAGFVADFLRTPLGLALAIYLPALFVIVAELRRLSAYYDSQKIFRLPWVKGKLYKPKPRERFLAGSKVFGLCLIIAALGTLPVQAALTTKATLTDNNIISTRPSADHVLIIGIFFRDKGDPDKPQLKFYNPTQQTVYMNEWTINDNQGEIFKFRGATRIEGKQTFTYNPQTFSDGFQYSGDRLVLKNAAGQTVDAVSWGTDTSQLDPAAPAVNTGDKLRRIPRIIDTNTAEDWKIRPSN